MAMDSRNTMLCGLLVLCVATAVVSSHTVHMGRTCPDIDPYPNLAFDKLLGTWYVVYQFDTSNTCLIWNITKQAEEEYAITETRQLWLLDALSVNHQHKITAQLDIPNPEVPARMRVRWPTSFTGKADFTVFDTDYNEYMAVFECDRAGFLHRRSVTVLSRTSVMDQIFVDRVRRLLDAKNIPHHALDAIDHNVCREKGRYNWHTDGELFGLLNSGRSQTQEQRLGTNVENYDISQLETLGDGVMEDSNGKPFKGSFKNPRSV